MVNALANTAKRSFSSIFTSLKFYTTVIFVLGFDTILFVYNAIAPKKAPGKITLYGGKWPKYIAPQAGDSRSSCPALNALANHGVFPHNGRGISFLELNKAVRQNFNFAPTFCWFVPNHIAQILSRDYHTGTFDLEDLSVHNGIEHDASMTREDTYLDMDQGKPSPRLIKELLTSGTGPNGQITIKDLARFSAKRRVEARATNPQFSLSFIHKLFGSSNASTMLTHFNGNPVDLAPYLLEERFPDGWEPAINDAMGLTMMKFNHTVIPVEMNTCEEEFRAKRD
jgi:hypothetical protein